VATANVTKMDTLNDGQQHLADIGDADVLEHDGPA